MSGLFLPKNQDMESLKKNAEFRTVYHEGTSIANRQLVMYILNNGKESNRIGISVSKKVGNSVVRHHITRLIREIYRLHEDQLSGGYDIVVIARNPAASSDYHQLEKAFLHLANLHHLLKEDGLD